MTSRVSGVGGGAWSLLVCGGETLVEARKRLGKVLCDHMHPLLRHLEFRGHVAYDLLYVVGMVDEGIGGRIYLGVGVVVDGVGELCKFAVDFLLPLFHGFGEVLLRECGVVVGIIHSFELLSNCLPRRCLS